MNPEDQDNNEQSKKRFTTKKCPFCYVHLPLDVKFCETCKSRVGEVDKLGFAAKPVDWKGYVIAAISMAVFALFAWWAFFRE